MAEYRQMIFDHHHMSLFYQIQGQGPPLILLHGFLEDHTIWDEMASELIQHFTIIFIDIPGHGRSVLNAQVLEMEGVAEAILALTDHLGFNSLRVMGHSMGGYVALAMIELRPDGIDSIYLLNSTPLADSAERRIERDRAWEAFNRHPRAFIRMAIANLFSPEDPSAYKATIAKLTSKAQTFSVPGVQAAILGMKLRLDRRPILASFAGEKVILAGVRDPLLAIKTLHEIADITDSQFVTLKGGHMGWAEDTAGIVKKLLFNE